MPLPPPAPRAPAHTRRVTYCGYPREDGLWDIEGELHDSKAYTLALRGRDDLPAGSPVHHMHVRLTIDEAMQIVGITAALDATPFGECGLAEGPVQRLLGVTLGRGWRRAIDEAMGGVRGCTHLRELLFGAATAAFQTMGSHREQMRIQRGEPSPVQAEPPYYMGQCMSWDFDGPVVARVAPEFSGWKPLIRK